MTPSLLVLCSLTLRKASRAPCSINSVMIMMGFPETQSTPRHAQHALSLLLLAPPLPSHPVAPSWWGDHTLCDNAFQMQNVRVVELAHDGCLSKEVPPVAIRRGFFQDLNGHSLAVLAGEPQGPSIHFSKFSWEERK